MKHRVLVFHAESFFADPNARYVFAFADLVVALVLSRYLGWFSCLFVLALALATLPHYRTLTIGNDGIGLTFSALLSHIAPNIFVRHFISFESFKAVMMNNDDVLLFLTHGIDLRLHKASRREALHLRRELREWYETYNALVLESDEVDAKPTMYREPAIDRTWIVALSPAEPIADRARAALYVLRNANDERAAQRLALAAAGSVHTSFSVLVKSLVTSKPLAHRTKKRIARDLGIRATEL